MHEETVTTDNSDNKAGSLSVSHLCKKKSHCAPFRQHLVIYKNHDVIWINHTSGKIWHNVKTKRKTKAALIQALFLFLCIYHYTHPLCHLTPVLIPPVIKDGSPNPVPDVRKTTTKSNMRKKQTYLADPEHTPWTTCPVLVVSLALCVLCSYVKIMFLCIYFH